MLNSHVAHNGDDLPDTIANNTVFHSIIAHIIYEKLSYRRGTARRAMLVNSYYVL